MEGDAAPFDWDAYDWPEEARGRKGSLLQGESDWPCARARARSA